MLRQNLCCDERTRSVKSPCRHYTLPLAEEIRKVAPVVYVCSAYAIAYGEVHLAAGTFGYATILDQTTKLDRSSGGHVGCKRLRRCVEIRNRSSEPIES